ncbi:hypothetical protein [Deferrisoma sp.]
MHKKAVIRVETAWIFALAVLLALCPRNGACESLLVFSGVVEGNRELLLGDPEGGEVRRLTWTPYDERQPSWSGDRRFVVYATSDGAVRSVDVGTGEVSLLVDANARRPAMMPALAPDGERLVYVRASGTDPEDTDLQVLNLRLSEHRTLLRQPGAQMWPVWSPEGGRIAYASCSCTLECGTVVQDLWTVNRSGKRPHQRTLSNALCRGPDWSPDGSRIVFSSNRDGSFDLFILSLVDGTVEKLTEFPGAETSPAWSPDGRRIAFVATEGGERRIWVRDLDSGADQRFSVSLDVEIMDVDW